ncbi:MAG: hypothetical protein NT069_19920 [Planctomycetota bacterium]|nr:hypothetical protein [Planctomycetota bacterium]
MWGATKAYWLLTADVPLSQSPTVWDHYFPQIRRSGLADRKIRREDRQFDLLLMGGSVLQPTWGTIEAELRQRLEAIAPGRIRIYNLAEAGFTSRDSRVQYEHFKDDRFDLVLVYEGINDVRMNCCPPEEFHDDYSHFTRYGLMMQRLDAGTLSLPTAVLDRFRSAVSTLPLGTADPQLVDFAANPQSPRTLKANLEAIAQTAIARGDPLLLLTYAWYIPGDYTPERFRDGTLDYSHEAPHACGAEMWGRPEHVANAMRLQNEAIREIARSHLEVRFVDQSEQLPKNGDNFCDPCHLTTAGCRRFVDNIWPEIERALRASPAWK